MNLLLNADGDIELVDGQLALATGKQEILQNILIALTTFKGEFFLDLELGFPWFQAVFKKRPSVALINSLFVTTIATVEGVQTIISFDLNFDTASRKLSFSLEAETIAGTVDYSGELL